MKKDSSLTGLARIIGLIVAIALLLSLLLPIAGAAQEAETSEQETTEALSEVPSTGARRPGPIILASSPVTAAAPAETETPEPEREGVTPVEMQVDSIGLDAPIETGAIVDGAMMDPSGPWVVSWYEPLGKVGEGHNVVMAGHVDYWNTGPDGTAGPAVFWDIPNMTSGEIIRLVAEDGEQFEYAVEWVQEYDVATELTPEVIQKDIVGDTGQESLTLITCGGDFDAATGEYLKRWVLRAHLV